MKFREDFLAKTGVIKKGQALGLHGRMGGGSKNLDRTVSSAFFANPFFAISRAEYSPLARWSFMVAPDRNHSPQHGRGEKWIQPRMQDISRPAPGASPDCRSPERSCIRRIGDTPVAVLGRRESRPTVRTVNRQMCRPERTMQFPRCVGDLHGVASPS